MKFQSAISTSLPTELWHQIFNELTIRRFPMKDLDYKLLRCKQPSRVCRKLYRSQPWIAHSLLLVCKLWNSVVKPMLYNTIFLWKASQITDLALLLRGQGPPSADHPRIGSWIRRIVIMIHDPKDRIDFSNFGELMSSCHKLTALHVVMHFPDASDRYPSSLVLFENILHTASTLQILNLVACAPHYSDNSIPNDFFKKMTALRAFRSDNDINPPNIQLLDYLSVGGWTLGKSVYQYPSMAIRELFIRDISSFPISYPQNEDLRRLNLDITGSFLSYGSELDDSAGDQTVHNLLGGSGVDLDGHGSEEEEVVVGGGAVAADQMTVDNPESDFVYSEPSASSEDFQIAALDVLPPTVTYLSIIFGRWEELGGRIRIQRLPISVTGLGLEAGEEHCKAKSYRHLIHICRDLIAPGLTVVQLNHWQTCVDLRTRHPGLLKEFVEMLGNRNVELLDAEGSVMKIPSS
ncbi:hypothetical protein ONZ45_g10465 [Pleurotus djamor]|nr:hypothetical protein ONZ45_g10465 [Pleurotus djamor]